MLHNIKVNNESGVIESGSFEFERATKYRHTDQIDQGIQFEARHRIDFSGVAIEDVFELASRQLRTDRANTLRAWKKDSRKGLKEAKAHQDSLERDADGVPVVEYHAEDASTLDETQTVEELEAQLEKLQAMISAKKDS